MKEENGKKIYSVAEINYISKQVLEEMLFWVEGEISSFQEKSSWFHIFFNLKDEDNVLPCFSEASRIADVEKPLEGKKVLIYGQVTLFKKNEYKFKVFSLEESGEGVLKKKFEKLYKKLSNEGLFNEKNKKSLPEYPKRICLVTSEGSAGWHDFKTHTTDKFPIIELYTADVRVEGVNAIKELLNILPKVDKMNFDAVVITRGGGSVETLLEVFNDEALIREISKMNTPTLVAIGHEINISMSELAADKRASTPTDAANIITAGYVVFSEKLENYLFRFKNSFQRIYEQNSQAMDSLYYRIAQARSVFKDLPFKLTSFNESLKRYEKLFLFDTNFKVDKILLSLEKESQVLLKDKELKLKNLYRVMRLLSTENTLLRGYSITTDSHGRLIRDAKDVVVGQTIGVELFRGKLKSKVTKKNEKGSK